MIGPVNDYRDIYVAACGEVCTSWATGKDHERHCPRCAVESEEECDVDDRGICYERD
jgi:hypothetical protein